MAIYMEITTSSIFKFEDDSIRNCSSTRDGSLVQLSNWIDQGIVSYQICNDQRSLLHILENGKYLN